MPRMQKCKSRKGQKYFDLIKSLLKVLRFQKIGNVPILFAINYSYQKSF